MTDDLKTFTVTCPICDEIFESEIAVADLLKDPDEPMAIECPECGEEWDQPYTYDAATDSLTLGEPLLYDDEDDEDEDDDEDLLPPGEDNEDEPA